MRAVSPLLPRIPTNQSLPCVALTFLTSLWVISLNFSQKRFSKKMKTSHRSMNEYLLGTSTGSSRTKQKIKDFKHSCFVLIQHISIDCLPYARPASVWMQSDLHHRGCSQKPGLHHWECRQTWITGGAVRSQTCTTGDTGRPASLGMQSEARPALQGMQSEARPDCRDAIRIIQLHWQDAP